LKEANISDDALQISTHIHRLVNDCTHVIYTSRNCAHGAIHAHKL